jgi:hypothetical protein
MTAWRNVFIAFGIFAVFWIGYDAYLSKRAAEIYKVGESSLNANISAWGKSPELSSLSEKTEIFFFLVHQSLLVICPKNLQRFFLATGYLRLL